MSDRSAILIADDDDDALVLLENAFELAQISNPRRIVRNGREAIDYLSGNGIYADREMYPWPALMLLDLKMPASDGFEVLKWWSEHKRLKELPIIVMTSSNQESDIQKAMALGASAYQVKPGSFNYLVEVARELRERWLKKREDGRPARLGWKRARGSEEPTQSVRARAAA